jgi:hypothetical protein
MGAKATDLAKKHKAAGDDRNGHCRPPRGSGPVGEGPGKAGALINVATTGCLDQHRRHQIAPREAGKSIGVADPDVRVPLLADSPRPNASEEPDGSWPT